MATPERLSVILLAVLGSTAFGMFMMPSSAPVERLIRNTRAYIRENPEDPEGYYTLARIHYLAFANRTFEIPVIDREGESPPQVAADCAVGSTVHLLRREHAVKRALQEFGYASQGEIPQERSQEFWERVSETLKELERDGWQPPHPPQDELNQHAAAASEHFRKAIQLDPDKALYHLGIASLLEQYAGFIEESCGVPPEFTAIILDKARDAYCTAYDLSVRRDLRLKHLPIQGLASLVSHEAGQGYIRLSEDRTDASRTERRRLASIKRGVDKLRALQPDAITPIIFSLEEHSSLADLLAPDIRVRFDLDGNGSIEDWPWIKPTTGVLVWDPDGTSTITSGRQFFGSVTWWLFFPDGYRALDCLDDNRDGRLTRSELAGISAWFDRNSDGRSAPGEVTPLTEFGVVSLATRAAGHDGDSLVNVTGLAFADGRTAPTYDWIALRVETGRQPAIRAD